MTLFKTQMGDFFVTPGIMNNYKCIQIIGIR